MSNQYYIEKYKDMAEIEKFYFQLRDKNNRLINIDGITNPIKVDNRQEFAVIDNQGQKPHCAGYSICSIIEANIYKRTGRLINLNADQVYAKAKTMDGDPNGEGTYLETAIKAAIELGGLGKYAKNIKVGYLYNGRDDKTVEQLKYLIHKYEWIHAGFNITSAWYNCNASDYRVHLGGQILGGHAVVIVGYDMEGCYIANSWGQSFGHKGFCILPWNVFREQFIYACFLQNSFDGLSEA